MGNWFSNLHIRKTKNMTTESVIAYIQQLLAAQHYLPIDSQEEADAMVAICADDAYPWISVYSELLTHSDPDSSKAVAYPISADLHTDVLTIACFDSDYLYVNLVNAEEETDAWVGIGHGSCAGIRRRTALKPWKAKLPQSKLFSEKSKLPYICAEEFLAEVVPCLQLPMERSAASAEYLQDYGLEDQAVCLYFKLQGPATDGQSPVLQFYSADALPCMEGRSTNVEVCNHGAAGQGLIIFFMGPYVEQEEIRFENVKLIHWSREKKTEETITLQKIQLADGQWAYFYHDHHYRLQPKLPDHTDYLRQRERNIHLQFHPVGNSRKMLDVTVAFVPEQNPQGLAVWNVWHPFGSKKAFIQHHNKLWKRVRAFETNPDSCLPLLKEGDYD